MSGTKDIIRIDKLCWEVEGRTVLNDINFTISEGSFVGLLGPNGAGKSSLMRCFYGANLPTEGDIKYKSRSLVTMKPRDRAKQIAVILQEHSPYLELRVEEIIALGLIPHKGLFEKQNKKDTELVNNTIKELDLEDLRHDVYSHLSGGEKQRVMLAKAIVQRPELLIMDEPTNHLDVHYQIELLSLVKSIGKTVLASFHDLNLAMAFCDEIVVLDKGELVTCGEPTEVMTEDLISSTFNTCALVKKHPLYSHPQISYAYHNETK